MTALTIISYSYYKSTDNILKMAENLMTRTNKSVIEKLDDYLTPSPLLEISSALLEDHLLTVVDIQKFTSFMYVFLRTYPQLNNIYLADLK